MKKNGTLIMLLAVFILTAAFGKTAEADGVEPAQHDHIWEQADVAMRPTCTSPAYYVIRCQICGKEETHITEPALGHDWTAWDLVKPAQCTYHGAEARRCRRCNVQETREVAPLGHSWGAWKVTQAPSCFAEGKETRECSRCLITESRAIPKTEHKWGDWHVTTAPKHGNSGTEERRCPVCMATETRTIPAEKPEMQLGDSGILVVIAQELLKDGGEYTGVCDGIFREDLALAIKTYEKSAGLNETGAIYPDTLPLLAKRFLESLEGEIPSGECTIFIFQDTGLHVDALRECKYTSNGDGTHRVEPGIIGFDFNNWKEEQEEIYFPAGTEFKQNAYNSPCHPDGDKSVCMDCGADMGAWLTQQVELNLDALLAALDKYGDGIGINLNILPDELTDYDLPPVSGMSYSLYWNALQWDTFEGALRYDVYLWSIGKDGPDELLIEDCVDDTGGDTNSFGFPMLNGGQYLAALLAKDDSGAVSDHTFLYFGVGDGAMPEPLEVELKDGCASWAYEYGNLNPLFHVDLIRTYVIDHGLNHESVYEADTENAYMDLTEVYAELAVKGTIEPGDSLFVGVMAMDADGNLEDSAMVHSEFVPWTAPNFYRVLCAVNVRRGPGKSFERIGGYSLGDYFVSFGTETGEDGTYYVVNYKGQTGYVLSSCAAWFAPKLFTSHVDMGDGKSAEVFTNPDGTIDQTDLENKVQKLGWRLTGLKQTAGSGTGELDLTKVLSPGDTFEAIWEKDPDYVFVRFCKNGRGESAKVYDPEGKLTDKEIPIRIGTAFRIRTGGGEAYIPGWRCWDGDSYLEVTDATPFTAKMTTVFMYEKKGQEITLGKQTLTGRREELLYLYDENNKQLSRLQEGDVLTITDRDNRAGNFAMMYKVSVKRLNKEGYAYAELLEGLNGAESWNVYFDPDGGFCPVAWLKATHQAGYSYPTLTKLPVASRSGYYFAGWMDKNGNTVTPGYEFTDSVVLKPKWIKYIGYTAKQGLTISFGYGKPATEQTRPYGFETPASSEKIELPVCEELKVIGETGEMYRCLRNDNTSLWVPKKFITTDYEILIFTPYQSINYYEIVWEPGSHKDSVEIMSSLYNGKSVYLLYHIGDRGNWMKVAAPSFGMNWQDPRVEQGWDVWSGVGWVYNYGKHETICRVNFCAGEGICWLDSVDVPVGQTIGSVSKFPVPCLSGYEFEGWYTDPVLGEWVDAATPIRESMTVYAHYKYLYDDYQAATQDAPIYDRTSTSKGEILGYVEAGETVIVQKESKEHKFAWVTHKGVSGWVQTRYLVSGNVKRVIASPKTDMAIRSEAKYKKGTVYRKIKQAELFLDIGSKDSYEKVAYPCADGYAYIAKDQFE